MVSVPDATWCDACMDGDIGSNIGPYDDNLTGGISCVYSVAACSGPRNAPTDATARP